MQYSLCVEYALHWRVPRTIHSVMLEAEQRMRDILKSRTVAWLADSPDARLPDEQKRAGLAWFLEPLSKR